ncbi:DUF3224 domain-containing protein [Thalassotalea ganghwensis]
MKITGTFEVKLQPIESYATAQDDMKLARMSIDKTFFGDLQATSQGEMLSAMTTTQGSAGYVAIEQVKGILSGAKGSFILQHFGIMDKGQDRLILEVIPDSGTEQLKGLSGTMTINIVDGKHFYEFDYQLTASP